MDGHDHYHSLILLEQKVNVTNKSFFDLNLNDRVYHPNIQSARNWEHVLKYIMKEGNYSEEGELPQVKKMDAFSKK